MALPNVVGVAVGERAGSDVLVVFVRRLADSKRGGSPGAIPRRIDGVDVDVREMGDVTMQAQYFGKRS
jgi:hypothetical protein